MKSLFCCKTLTAGVMFCLLLVGCQKENGGMRLVAEGFGGSGKAAVDGVNSYWVNGERVRINGVDKTVAVDGTTAYITDVAEADEYRALYPDTLNSSASLNNNNVTVTIPRTYTYMESDGRQHLGVPMAAYGTDDGLLKFKHLTAAITVEIKNVYGFTIEVDSVVVISNNYQLSGSKSVVLGPTINVEPNDDNVDAADKRVKVSFNAGTMLRVPSGETRYVQVPVLPVGDDNRFTIRVGVHKMDDAIVNTVFEREQGSSHSMARAQMGYAGVSFGQLFSVSTKKVIISQGNLQYVPSTGVWSFHTHQYDICETGIVDSTERYKAGGLLPIDLFGFGTSGYDEDNNDPHMTPYMTSKNPFHYHAPTNVDLNTTQYDWGRHNAISNGGNEAGRWYVLKSNDWNYLFKNSRETQTTGIDGHTSIRYTFATIGSTHKGIIIFPDVYNHPDVTITGNVVYDGVSDFAANISYDGWAKMEAAGAVFLPAASYRSDNGCVTGCYYIGTPLSGRYWAGGQSNSSTAYSLKFSNGVAPVSNNPTNSTNYRYLGMSVRLVRDL